MQETQSHTEASALCDNNPPRAIAWGWDSVYGAFNASIGIVLAGQRILVCALARRADPS
jgi:hypothetical protein